NTEYLLYQSLVAAWPGEGEPLDDTVRERLATYLTKAMREMKAYTSWTNTDERTEETIQGFLTAILHPRSGRAFIRRVGQFVTAITPAATCNSLAMVIVKATAPGFPDFYQGTEFWNRSLTDPDNRRPVDYAARQRTLETLDSALPATLAAPATKLWLTRQLLRLRAAYPELFAAGEYQPLHADGERAANLFAFARRHGNQTIVVAVPRLTTKLARPDGATPIGAVWGDTTLPLPTGVRAWQNWFTGASIDPEGGQLRAADLCADFPFAILTPGNE
ncbi:MAG TPA: hypothetical protein VIL85_02280, partial [Thermomicrobiales bacterium]